MDENYEAAILQSFIQLQATKHGDHLLKALPVIASSMPAIASSVPAIASSKQAYGSSHQPTQVIIKPKNEMIEDYCGDSMGSDPRHSDQDEYCNPHEDSQIISSNQIFLQKLQQYQNFQHLQKLQQFENERHHMENEREDLEPHRSIFSHVSHKQDLLDIKPVQVIREAHRPEILTGKPVFVITSVQSVNTSVIKKNGNPLVAKKDEMNENLPKAEIPVKPSKCSKPVKVVKPLKRVISKPSADGVQPKSEDGNPLCAVCGEKAGKHSYYGGQVCASCRAFFRRAVQSGCHVSFCCVNKSDSCAITVLTRKNCQFCRYEKCLFSGMRPNWILSEEERVRRFHGRRKRKNGDGQIRDYDSLEDPDSPVSGSCTDQPASTCRLEPPYKMMCSYLKPLTLDETTNLRNLAKNMFNRFTGSIDDIDPSLLNQLLQTTIQGGQLTTHIMDRVAAVLHSRTKMCLTLNKDFQHLNENDKTTIIRNNIPLLHRLRQVITMSNSSLTLSDYMKLLIGESRLHVAESSLPCDLSSNSGVSKTTSSEVIDYMQILFQHKKDDSNSLDLVNKISRIVDVYDEISLILLILITVFNTDFIQFENRKKVEDIQLKYVCLLQRYLNSTQRFEPLDMAASGPTALSGAAFNLAAYSQTEPMNLAVRKSGECDLEGNAAATSIQSGATSSIQSAATSSFQSGAASSIQPGSRRSRSLVDFLLVPSLLRQINEISQDNLFF